MSVKIITPPAAEPVSDLDCWRHLRLDAAYDSPPPDTVTEAAAIRAYLSAAREWAEAFTCRSLAPQTLELALDWFPCASIALPKGPVQSVASVTYTDTDGNPQTVSSGNYVLDSYSTDVDWLIPAYEFAWPHTLGIANAVKIRYVAGFDTPGDSPQTHPLPMSIRAALLLLVADLFEHRENTMAEGRTIVQEVPFGVKAMLMPHRLVGI
jgi:uncharacterized phiE125 gp8 family phage protein